MPEKDYLKTIHYKEFTSVHRWNKFTDRQLMKRKTFLAKCMKKETKQISKFFWYVYHTVYNTYRSEMLKLVNNKNTQPIIKTTLQCL